MLTCEIKTSDKTERRDITHDKLHFMFIFHWNCFCSCVNHYPHEEAEMSQGALQCTGWPVPLQFKDKCWQWKENWLTMIFQLHHTGCCKTSVKLWKHITETLYGVFFVFLGSFDCQIWAIFHFGTVWANGWKISWKIWPWKKARFQGWLILANFLIS